MVNKLYINRKMLIIFFVIWCCRLLYNTIFAAQNFKFYL